MAKPIDQDQGRTAIEKVVLLHSHIPRGGGVPPRGPHRGALGLVLRLRAWTFIVVFEGREWGSQVSSLRIG